MQVENGQALYYFGDHLSFSVAEMTSACQEALLGPCEDGDVVCLIHCQAKHGNNVKAFCYNPPGAQQYTECVCEYPC
ncbi:hypothetical protein ACHQM5_003129 [Ranunculus cassubicifolius]